MVCGILTLTLMAALPALAQSSDGPEVTVDFQVGKASPDAKWLNLGYMFKTYATFGQFDARPVVEFTLLNHSFGGGGYTDKVIMGGLVLEKPASASKVSPFGEVQAGILTCCGDTSFGIRYGGGVRYEYGPQLDFRVRFSLLTGFYDGFVDTGWGLGGGIVWKVNQ
jgi:hypothetical protein